MQRKTISFTILFAFIILVCLLNLYFDMADITFGNTDIKYSVNGSWLYPNGVIVLVDEDMEEYFEGTLKFYDQDKLPQYD